MQAVSLVTGIVTRFMHKNTDLISISLIGSVAFSNNFQIIMFLLYI